MEQSLGGLRVYPERHPTPGVAAVDPVALANRELLRPPSYRRGHHTLEPFSVAWFDELEQKRYHRHGAWLSPALEFARHPGESVLVLHPGLGSDAVRYTRHGCEVAIALAPTDDASLVRTNLSRHGIAAPIVAYADSRLPFASGAFDVAMLNALHTPVDLAWLGEELFRVLKAGGKFIGLFPAQYDVGYWQDLLLPYQHLYWRRPPDPTSGEKTTARRLREQFARFGDLRVFKRHLRRAELPHVCRILPLVLLERLVGRVVVFKALKPISAARTATMPALQSESLAA